MSNMLPAPSIVGPVSSWSRQILVSSLVSGAKVAVFARDAAGSVSQISGDLTPGSGEQLIEIARQPAGVTLWAEQTLADANGDGDPATGPITVEYPGGSAAIPQLMSRLYEGSFALWIEGVFPGATVRVEQGGIVLAKNQSVPLAGIMNRPSGARLHLNQHVQPETDVDIIILDPDGTELSRLGVRPRAPRDDFEVTARTRQLPPVIIAKPLVACSSGVPLSGVVDGAEVTLIVNGKERAKATFDRPGLTFLLSDADAVNEGDVVEATQVMWSTAPSESAQKEPVGPAPTPGAPGNGPACAGGRVIFLNMVDSDAILHVEMQAETSPGTVETVELTYPSEGAEDASGTRRITLPAPLRANTTLSIWQTRCEKIGAKIALPVKDKQSDPPAAELIAPLRGCDEYVYRDGGDGLPMRVYSKRLAESTSRAAGASDINWEYGAISDWSTGPIVPLSIKPLVKDDLIRTMVLACDGLQIWSPSDTPWTVEAGASPDEAMQTALGLVFSLSPDGNHPMPLIENAIGPVNIHKGPRAHLLSLTGGTGDFLGYGVPDTNGFVAIELPRPLVTGEMLMLEWQQCERSIFTKGNKTSAVQKIVAPMAPAILTPGNGQANLSLGVCPVKVRDPGEFSNQRATNLHVTVGIENGPLVFDKAIDGTSFEDAFEVKQNATTYVVTAQSSNTAGVSQPSQVKVTSVAPPPPPKKVHVKAKMTGDGNLPALEGDYDVTVDGSGFPPNTSGNSMILFQNPDGTPGKSNTPFTTDGSGKFSNVNGKAHVIFRIPRQQGIILLNDGVVLRVVVGSNTFEFSGVVNEYDGPLNPQ